MLSKRLRNHLIVAAVFLLLTVIGTIINSSKVAAQQGPPDGLAVRIVNPVPVPVTGSTTVSGTVAATQSGPWNVGISGQPIAVNVNNSPTVAPHQTSDIVAIQASSVFSSKTFRNCVVFDRLVTPPTVVSFTIPNGQVFVMTSVDWTAVVPSNALKSLVAYFFLAVGGDVNGPAATGIAVADSGGEGGGTVTFPTGVIVRGNQQMCIAVQTVPGTNQYAPADGVAHGFFAPQ
jgi:hypothetical protein